MSRGYRGKMLCVELLQFKFIKSSTIAVLPLLCYTPFLSHESRKSVKTNSNQASAPWAPHLHFRANLFIQNWPQILNFHFTSDLHSAHQTIPRSPQPLYMTTKNPRNNPCLHFPLQTWPLFTILLQGTSTSSTQHHNVLRLHYKRHAVFPRLHNRRNCHMVIKCLPQPRRTRWRQRSGYFGA